MRRPRRSISFRHARRDGSPTWFIEKRRIARECLCSRSNSKWKLHTKQAALYLDHGHSKRVNICFLGVITPFDDLWSRPPRRVNVLTCSGSDRIQVSSENGGAETRNARTRGVVNYIHKHVGLTGRQYGETAIGTTTHCFEVSVN